MRIPICILIALPFSLPGQTSGTCANPFEAAATPGREIAMNLRAGDITIVGTDAPVVRVSCAIGNNERASRDIRISFAADHLTIRGGSNDGAHFRIEVPRSTNLRVRKAVGDAASYRHAEASVLAGDLRASAFGVEYDGLFRSFKKDNPAGRYRLRAQLLAGDLILR